jgi:hypothetical protein
MQKLDCQVDPKYVKVNHKIEEVDGKSVLTIDAETFQDFDDINVRDLPKFNGFLFSKFLNSLLSYFKKNYLKKPTKFKIKSFFFYKSIENTHKSHALKKKTILLYI